MAQVNGEPKTSCRLELVEALRALVERHGPGEVWAALQALLQPPKKRRGGAPRMYTTAHLLEMEREMLDDRRLTVSAAARLVATRILARSGRKAMSIDHTAQQLVKLIDAHPRRRGWRMHAWLAWRKRCTKKRCPEIAPECDCPHARETRARDEQQVYEAKLRAFRERYGSWSPSVPESTVYALYDPDTPLKQFCQDHLPPA